jgi:hypothetical protein
MSRKFYLVTHLSKIKVKGSWNNTDLPNRNRRASGVETMVCVLIHAPFFGAGINGPCGGKLRRGGLRFPDNVGSKPFFAALIFTSIIDAASRSAGLLVTFTFGD